MSRIGLRVKFSKILNSMFLAPAIWNKKSDFFVAIDYHYFTRRAPKLHDLEVERSILERQLAYFTENFEIFNPKNFSFESSFSEQRKQLAMLITIDDGDTSIAENLDVFEKYNIPIIIFLPIGLCMSPDGIDGLRSRVLRYFFEIEEAIREDLYGDADTFFKKAIEMDYGQLKIFREQMSKYRSNPDPVSTKKLLSVEELSVLVNHPLVTLSSHTMSHPILSQTSLVWAKWEIESSQTYIQKIGGDTRFFAYPYGFKESYTNEIEQLLSNSGIKFAFTTRSFRSKLISNPLEIGRVGMHSIYDESYLQGLIGGGFELWDKLLRR